MKHLTIAEITEEALNHLQVDSRYVFMVKTEYTCNAANRAIRHLLGYPKAGKLYEPSVDQIRARDNAEARFDAYVREMGCPTTSGTAFLEFMPNTNATAKSQRARALWLTWVHMLAVEEGV